MKRYNALVSDTHAILYHAAGGKRLGSAADLFSNPAYQPIDLTPEQIYLAHEIRPNEDPFDSLICAAAQSLDLPLLTQDTAIEDSKIDTVW